MRYHPTMDGDAMCRFSLTQRGSKTLYVLGVNPSTANEQSADRTMVKVMGFASKNGFDGFVMLNVYPQRCTLPQNLSREVNEELHQKNLRKIQEAFLGEEHPTILVAFGDTIEIRPYLTQCLKDIISVLRPLSPQWKQIGSLTQRGNPRHPSRASYSLFEDFDMEWYQKQKQH